MELNPIGSDNSELDDTYGDAFVGNETGAVSEFDDVYLQAEPGDGRTVEDAEAADAEFDPSLTEDTPDNNTTAEPTTPDNQPTYAADDLSAADRRALIRATQPGANDSLVDTSKKMARNLRSERQALDTMNAMVTPQLLGELPRIYDDHVQAVRAALDTGRTYELSFPWTAEGNDEFVSVLSMVSVFHGPNRGNTQLTERNKLYESIMGVATKDSATTPPQEVAEADTKVLASTYAQIRNARSVMHTPMTLWSSSGLRGPQRMNLMRSLRIINSQPKPVELIEVLQQTIPRFMWEGNTIPEGVTIPPDYQEELHRNWADYTPKDASYLTTPDKLAAGKAPFHKAMAAAGAAAADGYPDLAYQLKAGIVLDANAGDQSRESGPGHEHRGEVAIFPYIAAGAMTGNIPPAPGDAPYDYANGLHKFYGETWTRLEQELSDPSQPSPAADFMDRFVAQYGDGIIAPYVALSLRDHARRSNVDIVGVLHDLHASGRSWAEPLVEAVAALPDRPLITNQEVAEFAEHTLTPIADAPAPEAAVAALSDISPETDLYSFKLPLSSVASVPTDARATVTINLDPEAHTAQATIDYREPDGYICRMPYTVNFMTGDVTIRTIDDQPLDLAAAEKYKAVVTSAIIQENDNIKAAAAAEAAAAERAAKSDITRSSGSTSAHPTGTAARESEKVKTRGEASAESDDTATTEVTDDTLETPATAGIPRVHVTGTDQETITELMKERNIRGVDTAELAVKIGYLVNRANQTVNKTFGKRPSYQPVAGRTNVKLRQVNITEDKRRLRLFFNEGPNNTMELAGIFDKGRDDLAKEVQFMSKLIKKLTDRTPDNIQSKPKK